MEIKDKWHEFKTTKGVKKFMKEKVIVEFTKYEMDDKNYYVPSYETEGAAGADARAVEDAIINPGEIKLIKTGIAVAIPAGYELQARPRSGLALKHGITLVNSPGTIDCFSKDCFVKTVDGEKKIEELKINDVVFSYNEEKDEIEKDLISAIVDTGEQETLIIETKEGFLEITPGTKIYTKNKGLIKAYELEDGDELLLF